MATPNYVTVAEVKAFKVAGVVALPSGLYTDPEIEAEINLTEEIIEKITGDIFYVKSQTVKFDSYSGNVVHFPPRMCYKLLSVISCKEVDTDGTVRDTLVEGDDFVRYPYCIEIVKQFPNDSPRRFFRGGQLPKGQLNIQIEGTWGNSSCPLAIKRAALLLTLEKLKPGCTKLVSGEAKSVSWPDFSITFREASSPSGSYLGKNTGFVEVDRLLSDHINYSSLFLPVSGHKPIMGL